MARKQKKVTPLDRGPIEKFQHGDYDEEETIVAGVKQLRNTTIDPISTYLRRGSINQKQFEAGHSCTAGTWDGVKESRRPEQDGMTALRLALDGLRKFYRL